MTCETASFSLPPSSTQSWPRPLPGLSLPVPGARYLSPVHSTCPRCTAGQLGFEALTSEGALP